jgi:hypothetical protein
MLKCCTTGAIPKTQSARQSGSINKNNIEHGIGLARGRSLIPAKPRTVFFVFEYHADINLIEIAYWTNVRSTSCGALTHVFVLHCGREK